MAGNVMKKPNEAERQKILKDTLAKEKELKNKTPEPIKFERPQEGKIDDQIGGIKTFHVEKGEEKHTYKIITKRELTFHYTIRAKNEEDAMIRTLKFVGSDGSGVYMKGPMQLGKPLIREWIERIEKIG
tara:strand:+ start:81 stop:467 length:387 start_codon:yes stop_codon:yes gene_type:complete